MTKVTTTSLSSLAARTVGVPAALLLTALLPTPAAAGGPFTHQRETLTYSTVDPASGKRFGDAEIVIERTGDRVEIVEKRRQENGDWQTFRLQIDPKTMQLYTWRMTGLLQGNKLDTSIETTPTQVIAKVREQDGEVKTLRLERPAKPFVIVPLLKFYLAHQIETKSLDHNFDLVVYQDGSLDTVEIEVEKIGIETVKTKSGSYNCHHLKVGLASTLLSVAIPPGDLYLAVDGTHPFVLGHGKATRFSPTLRTELVSYTAK